jgi:hypothetical protein
MPLELPDQTSHIRWVKQGDAHDAVSESLHSAFHGVFNAGAAADDATDDVLRSANSLAVQIGATRQATCAVMHAAIATL